MASGSTIRVLDYTSLTVGNHQCFSNSTADVEDPRDLLYRELSTDTYFSLPFHDPGDSAETIRRQYATGDIEGMDPGDEEWAQKYNPPSLKGPGRVVDTDFHNTNLSIKTLDTLNPDAITIFHLCFSVSYIWRRGRKGIHRYYSLRDTYYNHLPFEIGYLTQTIMAKYQNVLELYEFAVRKEPGRYIGRPHLFFFYKNILEDCRTIIHLCNMMHEVTRKYQQQQFSDWYKEWIRVTYDPSAKFQDAVPRIVLNKRGFPGVHGTYEKGIEGWEHEKYLHEDKAMFERIKEAGTVLEKERQRQLKINKAQKNYFLDHAQFSVTSPTSRRTKRWRSNEPMIYGWEPEENQQ